MRLVCMCVYFFVLMYIINIIKCKYSVMYSISSELMHFLVNPLVCLVYNMENITGND